jgi:UV DNA damage endonuclease
VLALVVTTLFCARVHAVLAHRSDLVPLIRWNEAHGIRLFRLSSCILPWMTSYKPEELPDWPEIQAVSTY